MKEKFKMGLKDNGAHSLNRGLEMFELNKTQNNLERYVIKAEVEKMKVEK